jgi:fatty-acyl-CoA synthase
VFYDYLAKNLPDYARPLFLRICASLTATATFKSQSQDLMKEGYDPALAGDEIYFNDRFKRSFVKLDDALYASLQAGTIRL